MQPSAPEAPTAEAAAPAARLPARSLAALAALGDRIVDDDLALCRHYGRDWTRLHVANAAAVVRPRSAAQVAAVLRVCRAEGLAVVPSGGRTGLAGGAVAARGEVVLSLERLDGMGTVDSAGDTLRVGAGAITAAVHAHVAPHGLSWPIDFASKGSSQVGGNVATNAGGVRVLRYGLTRQWVLGLQVVLADGTVLEMDGALEKNNTGLDLRQLFIGSEGILGVITAATLKLTRLPRASQVVLLGCASLAQVVALLGHARGGPFTVAAFEFFTAACMRRLQQHRALRPPLQAPLYVLVELEGSDPVALQAAAGPWLEAALGGGLVDDGVVAASAQQAQQLWALREGISESLAATGTPHKNDVALPIAALGAFCAALEALFARRYPGWEICLFGHIGDGNLHVNVMRPANLGHAEFVAATAQADHDLFALVREMGGSISAEHGIGLLKKPYLHYTRSAAELAVLRQVKRALDPDNVLNPGKVIDG